MHLFAQICNANVNLIIAIILDKQFILLCIFLTVDVREKQEKIYGKLSENRNQNFSSIFSQISESVSRRNQLRSELLI